MIHRHGLDEKTAFKVEAALIDAYPGVTNSVNGHRSDDFGVMHSSEIIKKCCAEVTKFNHKALLISVNRSAIDMPLFHYMKQLDMLGVLIKRKQSKQR